MQSPAAQIGCPSSLVPYLLAPQHTPKPCLLDDAKLRSASLIRAISELTATSKITADFGLLWATSSRLPHKSPDLFDSCSSE